MLTVADRFTKITRLYSGAHDPNGHFCAMEAVAYVAGEPWSDHPECVSPVIGAFMRNWNDSLPDDETRTRLLRPLILPMLNTRCDAETDVRLAWLAVDWLTRVQAPAWMRLTASLRAHGEALAGLPEITISSWPRSKKKVAAAGAAAGATAWATAWAAAGAAAGATAWATAWAAAGAAAGATAWATAWAAAGAALAPTVTKLQASAVELVLRMCRFAKGEEA